MKDNVLKNIMMASVTCVCAVAIFDYFRKNPVCKKCKCEEGCAGCCSCEEEDTDERLSAEPEDFVEETEEICQEQVSEDIKLDEEQNTSEERSADVMSDEEDDEDEEENVFADNINQVLNAEVNTIELEEKPAEKKASAETDKKSDINILSI